jgi:hypothetical protein
VLRAGLKLADPIVQGDVVDEVRQQEGRARDESERPAEDERPLGGPIAGGQVNSACHSENVPVNVVTHKEPSEIRPQPAERGAAGAGDSVLVIGIAIAAVTVTAQSVGHLVGVRLLDDRYLHLNADDELGLAAWTSSSAAFAAAFGVLLLALLQETINRWLLALVGLVAFFSLDDAVVVHERAAEKIAQALGYGHDAERLTWPILFLPLFAAGLILLLYAATLLPPRSRMVVYWGISLFVLALAAEAISSLLYSSADVERGSWPDALEVIIEEGAELAGWIIIAGAFLAAVLTLLDEDREPGRRRPVA